jgi:hypothetical protein
MSTHPGTVGEILDKLPPVEGEASNICAIINEPRST